MSRILALTRVLVRVQVAPPRRSSGGAAIRRAPRILLHQVHARERHVELAAAGVFEQHEVALGFALLDFAQPEEPADAVLGVDHEVARLQIARSAAKAASCDLPRRGPRDQIGRIEQVFRSDDGELANRGRPRRARTPPLTR